MSSNNNNVSSKGTTTRFMLDSLNRLMDDLSAMDDHEQFLNNNTVVKEESRDFSYEQEISNFKQEPNNDFHRFTYEIPFKEELDEFAYVDCADVFPEAQVTPQLQFVTEFIIRNQSEDLHYQFHNCVEDLKNKNLRIVLRRFKCFMCDHCPLFYRTKKNLARHIHSKHFLLFHNTCNISKSWISCGICRKTLLYKSWHEHMSLVHSIDGVQCKLCHKVFKHEHHLRRHTRHVHEKCKPKHLLPGRPVECPLCLKIFSNKHALHTHNKTCHSEQAYTCKICNSTLKCKTYLNAHMRRVHYDDGNRHVCDICTKNFKSPRYLKIHKKNSHYSL